MRVQRLSSTDGFVIFDLDAATTSVGVVRRAPKILEEGAVLLARSVTYAFAVFGVRGHGGASAAINAKPEDRDTAVAAFVDEVRPLAEAGKLALAPALGTTRADLAPLGWSDPDPGLTAAGALAAARVDGSLEGRPAAVVGSGPVVDAVTQHLRDVDATLVDPRFDAKCDILFVAGKAGCLDHDTARALEARTIVPLTPVPVTARALAVLARADQVVIPDFLSTAGPLLAAHDSEGGDPVQRIGDLATELAEHGTGRWLVAAMRAEENLATWTTEKPFGRPLA